MDVAPVRAVRGLVDLDRRFWPQRTEETYVVGYLARRRLRGENSGTAFALGVTLNVVLVFVLGAATLVPAGLLLYYAGGIPLD